MDTKATREGFYVICYMCGAAYRLNYYLDGHGSLFDEEGGYPVMGCRKCQNFIIKKADDSFHQEITTRILNYFSSPSITDLLKVERISSTRFCAIHYSTSRIDPDSFSYYASVFDYNPKEDDLLYDHYTSMSAENFDDVLKHLEYLLNISNSDGLTI